MSGQFGSVDASVIDALEVGQVVRMVYKGESRKVLIESEPVYVVQKGLPYIKVHDEDKGGYRTFTLRDITAIQTV